MLERQGLDTGNPAVSFDVGPLPATSTMTPAASSWDLVSVIEWGRGFFNVFVESQASVVYRGPGQPGWQIFRFN